MCPGRSVQLLAFCSLLGVLAPASTLLAQSEPTGDEVLEAYLADHGLERVLAAHLRRRLSEGAPEDRVEAAESLGRLYVRMLTGTTDAARRQSLEAESRQLLEIVPEAESYELRINLAKATYLQAEELAERDALKLLSPADRAEAERVLRTVRPVFDELGAKLHRKIEVLEAREPNARDADLEAIRAELSDARRLRSLARYYAGWSGCYLAMLTNSPRDAQAALVDFGAILNAVPGRPASVERMPKDLLRYEHVARACMGAALCASLLGSHVEAQRWLDELERAEDLPPSVAEQLFARRIRVAAAAGYWADIDLRVKRHRLVDDELGREDPRLTVPEARLLAIESLQAARSQDTRPGLRPIAERCAQIALADLVSRAEVGHVLDLVRLFGTAPIGEKGFIVGYVRGLQTYERARESHRATGSAEEPATDAATSNLYREAAELLGAALDAADARDFPAELPRARVREGLALYYAGAFAPAAERFQRAAQGAPPDVRRDALWYAIVSLDRAVERGLASNIEPRDRLATLYLQEFPGSDNAARLLLRQTRADRLSDAKSVEVLLAVPDDSPLFEASRRQAARLLYALFKRASPADRDFAALRFADVGELALRLERARALAGNDEESRRAADAVVLRVRQLADALLSLAAPDVARAEAAMLALDAVQSHHGLPLDELQSELRFRRFQIALAKDDESQARRLLDLLRQDPDGFSRGADRLMLRRAQLRWKDAPHDPQAARDVVGFGLRVLDELEGAGEGVVLASVRESVADAAAALFRATDDPAMRELAIRTDRAQLESGQRTLASLRRLGELLERDGDPAGALSAWNEVLLSTESASDAWFEARYHSLRLMVKTTDPNTHAAFEQFIVLHPDRGPEPWRSKFQELELARPAPPAPPPAPAPGTPAPTEAPPR
ncbi:MAG: hypothetical protein SFY69_10740 [Planctomycetota bacterium]|nr:hypothetical protein [Planctomycetota bacterium]